MKKSKSGYGLETKLIHAGEMGRVHGAVTLPIFQSSTFDCGDDESVRYARLSNTPNHEVLHRKLAELEGAEDALVSASGMAAVSSTLLGVLKAGDHFLLQDCLYGGTHGFVTADLADLGVTFDFFNPNDMATLKSKIKANTKAIYIESLSNPLLGIPDFKEIVKIAKAKKLITIVDNTFATPLNFRPLDLGIDLSLHSATKYLNGHSDIVAGVVMGSAAHIKKIAAKLKHLGGSLDAHACFLLHRGLKTLSLRVSFQNQSALQIAKYLSAHAQIEKVYYPHLKDHPQHDLARQYFSGCGGVLSFIPKGGLAAAKRVIQKVKLAAHAPSLGGVETLIIRPVMSSHMSLSAADRKRVGLRDDLVRLAVGLENPEDLIADLDQALRASK